MKKLNKIIESKVSKASVTATEDKGALKKKAENK